jgi:hypothetical protein
MWCAGTDVALPSAFTIVFLLSVCHNASPQNVALRIVQNSSNSLLQTSAHCEHGFLRHLIWCHVRIYLYSLHTQNAPITLVRLAHSPFSPLVAASVSTRTGIMEHGWVGVDRISPRYPQPESLQLTKPNEATEKATLERSYSGFNT